eukprot:gene5581-6947_t
MVNGRCNSGLDQYIYHDELHYNCHDWSWSDTRQYNVQKPVHSGTHSLSFIPKNYEGLYFNLQNPIDPTRISHISFWVHGGVTGNQKLFVRFTQNKVAVSQDFFLWGEASHLIGRKNIIPGEWTECIINLDLLKPGIYDGIQILTMGSEEQGRVFIDDIDVWRRCSSEPFVVEPGTVPGGKVVCESDSCVSIRVFENVGAKNVWSQNGVEYQQYTVTFKNTGTKPIQALEFAGDYFITRDAQDIWGVKTLADGRSYAMPEYVQVFKPQEQFSFGCVSQKENNLNYSNISNNNNNSNNSNTPFKSRCRNYNNEFDHVKVVIEDFKPPSINGVLQKSPDRKLSRSEMRKTIKQNLISPISSSYYNSVYSISRMKDDIKENLERVTVLIEDFKIPSSPPTTTARSPPNRIASYNTNEIRKDLREVKVVIEDFNKFNKTGSARTEGYKPPNRQKRRNPQYITKMPSVIRFDSRGYQLPYYYQNANSKISNQSVNQESRFGIPRTNRIDQLYALKQSGIHQWGLFANQNIPAKTIVIEYIGEIIRTKVADKREKYYLSIGITGSYMFKLDEDTVIDSTLKGNLARFINHSCDPNCKAKIVKVDDKMKLLIYSKKNINFGEEITYNYQFPKEDKKIPCLCNSFKCNGYLN